MSFHLVIAGLLIASYALAWAIGKYGWRVLVLDFKRAESAVKAKYDDLVKK